MIVAPPVVVPRDVIRDAGQEVGMRGRVRARDPQRHMVTVDGELAAFFTPHSAANGWKRLGPIYVLPQFRGRGLMVQVYATIQGPMLAAIVDGNHASERLHEKAGFVRWRRFAAGWHWRRM